MRLLILLMLLAPPAYAGLWDADRPAPGDAPDSFDVLTGRFDRFPAEYYQARIERVAPALSPADDQQAIVDALPHFDMAAVAHFRAGRYAEAIILIDRQLALMARIAADRAATVGVHRARAVANKAACLHHRWAGSDSRDHNDLVQAQELLSELQQADPYNADARWALLEVEWLLGAPSYIPGADPVFPNLLGLTDASFRGGNGDAALARNGLAGCIEFLSRRVVYEAGWLDVDVTYALSLALYLAGREEESLFAWLRLCELIDDGATTRVANAPRPNVLKRLMGVHVADLPDQSEVATVYAELRRKADAWHDSRAEYAKARLQQGFHPDTHADFWAAWRLVEIEPPEPERPEQDDGADISRTLLLGGFGGLLLVLIMIFGATIFMSRKGPAPNVDEL